MGDVPPPSSSPNDHLDEEALNNSFRASAPDDNKGRFAQGPNPSSSAFQPHYQQQFDPAQHAFTSQFDMTQPQANGRGASQGPYNMGAMANALPQPAFRPGVNHVSQTRYNTDGSSPGVLPQMAPYAGQSNMNHLAGQQYYMPQHAHMPTYYNTQLPPSQQQANMSPRHSMGFYPNQHMMSHAQQPLPAGYYYPHPNHYPNHNTHMPGNMMPTQYIAHDPRGSSPGGYQGQAGGGAYAASEGTNNGRASSNVVRGPPRKPRQSGHAIWIGNLPPQTDLMSLVHHVCNEASGLESLFLISKSNCAFANFKDEQSCIRAQQKLHDSKFQSVRLVSRLRKSTVEGSSGQTAPTGPSSTSPHAQTVPPESTVVQQSPTVPAEDGETVTRQEVVIEPKIVPSSGDAQQKDKFFVLKSLTVEDLDLSVRNGVWATQSHNEESLNSAFKAADNVYLVFSANKSGEYFGYARMVSPINNDPAAAIEFAPKAQATNDLDLPKAIPTEATDNCPRGNIIDDSARGTIFWEIEREDGEAQPTETDSEDSASARVDLDGEQGAKAWGKPFKLEWLSTTRLPFYRTRGLRNPWNSNREVKIARDGTELEPSVGRRLIGLFNRVQSPAPPISMGMRQNMPVIAGYPPPPPMSAPFTA
ncbi:putative YT521-B-like domain-containing protein [Seiridium cardinale]|uniref:YT521-B-like domain-containing protein n=1 Tax=Seiridium cardinale TaxID=138064 RepID=A0ABR2XT63_9PEZI